MMAWDTMAVLMAGYESSDQGSAFIDITQYTAGREFSADEMPHPETFGSVFQRL
jgi:hypothetical protein